MALSQSKLPTEMNQSLMRCWNIVAGDFCPVLSSLCNIICNHLTWPSNCDGVEIVMHCLGSVTSWTFLAYVLCHVIYQARYLERYHLRFVLRSALFTSQPRHQLFWVKLFVAFLILLRQLPRWYIKLGHSCFPHNLPKVTYIHIYIHTCMHACIHTYIHTYIHT